MSSALNCGTKRSSRANYLNVITIRRAKPVDVPAMHRIINDCAEFGQMLPRSLASLYENVREFHVAIEAADPNRGDGGSKNKVVGVCGLSVVWANLAEVMALAVAPSHRGKGLGQQLVQACIEEAEQLGVRRIMTLTYEQRFFERLGFAVLDRQQLPLKVWSECVRCPKNQACDEIAMLLELEHVPEIAGPKPGAPPVDKYVVPVVRKP